MPIGNGLLNPNHELDASVVYTAQAAMRDTAEPLLAKLFTLKGNAERNIAKRQAFLEVVAGMADKVRTAYDDGDIAALNAVVAEVEKYEKSLLRAKRS